MGTPRRVLVLSANMGTGHTSAAEAVLHSLRAQLPGMESCVVDSFQYASQFVGKMFEEGYIQLLKSVPSIYGLLYESRDHGSTVSAIRRWANRLFAGNFKNLFDSWKPDIIVCTHAFAAGVTSVVREKYGLAVPCLGVVTDFVVHPYWIHRNMDMYAVATSELARQLTDRGLDRSRVRVTGIPIHPGFGERTQKRDILRDRLGVNSGLPVVLVMGGGLAMGPVSKILPTLKRLSRPMHVVIFAGKNQRMKERLQSQLLKLGPLPAQVQVLGYIDNVYEYMHAADLLVTKPGGMTSAEALAAGLPMLIVKPLPGQEMRNTKYLLAKSAAVPVPHERSLPRTIETMLGNHETRQRMQTISRRLARPDSAQQVASLVMELLDRTT